MSNDLLMRAQGVMEQVGGKITREQVWAARPWGHTKYQIEKFVFNYKEYPDGAPKFRQALRELWARWEAYWQVRDKYDELQFDLDALAAEEARLKGLRCLWRWEKMRRTADLGRLAWKRGQIDRMRAQLLLDLEHRIMPETLDILEVLHANAPTLEDTEAFSMKAEQAIWEHRAKTEPRLRELMAGSSPALANGKGM